MARYECSVCGHVYDESTEGTSWSDLPDDWTCPICGSAKHLFTPVGGAGASAAQPEGIMPRRLAVQHRVFGYIYLTIYLFFLWQMVPRLWEYQIEFPARTVVHLSLGMAIGAILFLKITIVRFFRRLDQALAPLLGTALFVSTVIVIGISAPFAFHEAIAGGAATGRIAGPENLDRVRTLLAQAGLDDEAERDRLASPDSFRAGRRVLRTACVECHDLRTVLAKPRTPGSWRQTVKRMADRTTFGDPIDEPEQWLVTAYLIAISPELQQSVREIRRQEEAQEESKQAAEAAASGSVAPVAYDPARAGELFESKCSQCHRTRLVETFTLESEADARALVARMVEEGLTATQDELSQIILHLTAEYATASKE